LQLLAIVKKAEWNIIAPLKVSTSVRSGFRQEYYKICRFSLLSKPKFSVEGSVFISAIRIFRHMHGRLCYCCF